MIEKNVHAADCDETWLLYAVVFERFVGDVVTIVLEVMALMMKQMCHFQLQKLVRNELCEELVWKLTQGRQISFQIQNPSILRRKIEVPDANLCLETASFPLSGPPKTILFNTTLQFEDTISTCIL